MFLLKTLLSLQSETNKKRGRPRDLSIEFPKHNIPSQLIASL